MMKSNREGYYRLRMILLTVLLITENIRQLLMEMDVIRGKKNCP